MDTLQAEQILAAYRPCAAKRDLLRIQLEEARRHLKKEKRRMEADMTLPGRDPDAPPGSTRGDPTARTAQLLASGWETPFVRELSAEVRRLESGIRRCDALCRCVEAWRSLLPERERLLVDMHMIGNETYERVLLEFEIRGLRPSVTTRQGMAKLKKRAIGRICAVSESGLYATVLSCGAPAEADTAG